MTDYPFFSVVIPTFNRAALIPRTLQTVLSQTYPHREIIVVDDCSTDNTAEVLQPFICAGQINFIQHDRNYERAWSRNTGFKAARGDFVTLLDSDDFMYPNNLADAAEYARAHPDIKCFHNLFEFVNSDGKVVRRYPMPSLDNQVKAIAEGNFMSCIGNFMHRDIYQHYKFDTMRDLSGGEDWEFWMRVLADFKVGRIEKINNGVLQHTGRSVNQPNVERMKRGLDHLYMNITTDAHLSQVYAPYLKIIRANSLLQLAILANAAGKFSDARDFVRQARNVEPRLLLKLRFWKIVRRAWLETQPDLN